MSPSIYDFKATPHFSLGIATDHGGFELKNQLIEWLSARGYDTIDCGAFCYDPQDDYPQFACSLAARVANQDIDAGILLCRSGIGMSIAANRHPNVRAALAELPTKARLSRTHNCSNILVTGGDDVPNAQVYEIVETWLNTPFSQKDRHIRRLLAIEEECFSATATLTFRDPALAHIANTAAQRNQTHLDCTPTTTVKSLDVILAENSFNGLQLPHETGATGTKQGLEQICATRTCALVDTSYETKAITILPFCKEHAIPDLLTRLTYPPQPSSSLIIRPAFSNKLDQENAGFHGIEIRYTADSSTTIPPASLEKASGCIIIQPGDKAEPEDLHALLTTCKKHTQTLVLDISSLIASQTNRQFAQLIHSCDLIMFDVAQTLNGALTTVVLNNSATFNQPAPACPTFMLAGTAAALSNDNLLYARELGAQSDALAQDLADTLKNHDLEAVQISMDTVFIAESTLFSPIDVTVKHLRETGLCVSSVENEPGILLTTRQLASRGFTTQRFHDLSTHLSATLKQGNAKNYGLLKNIIGECCRAFPKEARFKRAQQATKTSS